MLKLYSARRANFFSAVGKIFNLVSVIRNAKNWAQNRNEYGQGGALELATYLRIGSNLEIWQVLKIGVALSIFEWQTIQKLWTFFWNLNQSWKKGLYNFRYPSIWTSKFIKIHNCIITSSVVVEKNLLDKIGNFRDIQSKKLWADWDCWLGLLTHTDSYYFSDPLLYYNLSDGLNSKPQ